MEFSLHNWLHKQANPTEYISLCFLYEGCPGGSVVKNLPGDAGDTEDVGLIPGSGRHPGGGNSKPLQYSRLGNPTDRGTWWSTVCGGHKESDMTQAQGH